MSKKRVIFLSRSFLPSTSGGVFARLKQIHFFLKQGFEVVVVSTGSCHSREKVEGHEVQVYRFPIGPVRLLRVTERIGLVDDYLSFWAAKAFAFLGNFVTKDDLIFATSGGEAAAFQLGARLKGLTSARLFLSFHDPIDYTLVNGIKLDSKPHVPREKLESRCLQAADLIITSSDNFRESLIKKYPDLRNKIVNVYFGFSSFLPVQKNTNRKLRIVYAGHFGSLQAPEMLCEALNCLDETAKNRVEGLFIGNWENYAPLKKYANKKWIKFLPAMPQSECHRFLNVDCDLGFVPLKGDYLAACCPSKFFDYLSVGLPILGMLPNGDCHHMINELQLGISHSWKEPQAVATSLERLLSNPERLDQMKEAVSKYRPQFSTTQQFGQLASLL